MPRSPRKRQTFWPAPKTNDRALACRRQHGARRWARGRSFDMVADMVRERTGLPVPAALVHRILRPYGRPDRHLALSELHQFRSVDRPPMGGRQQLRAHVHRGPQIRPVDACHVHVRDLFGAAEARLRARHRASAQSRHARTADLSRHLLPTVAARRVGRHRGAVAHAVRRRRRDQRFPRDLRHPGAELDLKSALFAVDADPARRLAVRLADDHLPRRAQANPAGYV